MQPVLAEAPQFSAADIAIILLVLIGMALVALAAVVLGFVWAARAGRGSTLAFTGWMVIAGLESLGVISLLIEGDPSLVLPVGLLAGQGLVYWRARSRAGPPAAGGDAA